MESPVAAFNCWFENSDAHLMGGEGGEVEEMN